MIENICKKLANKPDIWYATMGDIALYVNASRKLAFSGDGRKLTNNSDRTIYFLCNGKQKSIAPGKTLEVK